MTILYILLGLLALGLLYGVFGYNALVKRKNLVEEGWSGIETQLKRRANVIPNLVETVKGYASHERDVFERVTQLRADSMQTGSVQERAQKEGLLTAAIGNLMAVAEDYPDLRANENFLSLQTDLADIEDHIQLARRYYNGTVRNLNIQVESFPSNLIANFFSFRKAEFFEIEDTKDRQVPAVSFEKNG